MILPVALLDFAFQSVFQETGGEAAIRRAVSAAYYAVFHALSQTGAAAFDGPPSVRERLARSYDHGRIASAAEDVGARNKPGNPRRPDPRLAELARAFLRLREARERADYDLASTVTWAGADELLDEAFHAFSLLHDLRGHPELADFLLTPLIQTRGRRG